MALTGAAFAAEHVFEQQGALDGGTRDDRYGIRELSKADSEL